MRNSLLTIFIFFVVLCKSSFAEGFRFETTEIEIINNEKLIYASNGKAFSFNDEFEIEAKNFEYNKDLGILKAFNGSAILKRENLKIDFDNLIYEEKDSIITAKENVKVYDIKNNLEINTELLIYDDLKKILKSSTKSSLNDKFQNIFITEKFEYKITENILKIEKGNFIDVEKNKFYVDLAYVNTLSNKLFGKNISIDLNNKSFNKNNEPRLKGKTIIYENDKTIINKGVFTTCKKRDNCPPWQISAKEINHDKKKQVVNYKSAWLKVYDLPVVYFPKFFHPDPTVKRRSGFLVPTIKNSSSSDNFLSLPYYLVISNNKDITFSPRLFADDKFLLQSEFRQVNYNSSHTSDFSIFAKKDSNTKSHFFYEYLKNFDLLNFEESNAEVKIQKTSNDTYLKGNKLKSPIIDNYDVLQSSLNFNFYSEDTSIDTELTIYEDLTKEEQSDRYEFVLPKIDLVKNLDNKTGLNGDFIFKSSNLIRNYDTNVFEKSNTNDLIFESNPKITNSGFNNNYDVILKNVNSDAQNTKKYKNQENYYVSGMLQLNSSLPLIKENEVTQKILKPKVALKISPENTKNIGDKEARMDANNVFNLERISSNDTIEGGMSLTYGNEFKILDKKESFEIFDFKIANILRLSEYDDLPKYNQMNQKTSNVFSEITYNPSKSLSAKYNITTKNNLKDINNENLSIKFSLNKFVTTFDYLNENNSLEKNSHLSNSTKYEFDEFNNLIFATRRNKKTDLTEYYNLMYQYKNDCLAASIEYNKDFYTDRDIKPEENIFFKLTIIPFGETSSPNLKK